jgi:putative spermidine/putrescine transport system permease protein
MATLIPGRVAAHRTPPSSYNAANALPGLARRGLTGLALAGTALFFLLPFAAAVVFSLQAGRSYSLGAYASILRSPGFAPALALSLRLALLAVLITLLLVVPTATFVHLRLLRYRRLFEAVTLIPLAMPAIVLATGILHAFQGQTWITNSPNILAYEYVVLALPFSYRALDAGLAAIDLRTLSDAARSLGAGWPQTMVRVLAPNMRTAITAAALLTLALSFGEYVLPGQLLFQTLPVWLVSTGSANPAESVAVSIASLIFVWLLLMAATFAGTFRARRRHRGRA